MTGVGQWKHESCERGGSEAFEYVCPVCSGRAWNSEVKPFEIVQIHVVSFCLCIH